MTSDVATRWLSLDTPDGRMRVYQVDPGDGATHPRAAVLVLQEAFGVNDHIQDVTRRIASEGYLALAPDLFHRTGVATVDYADRDTAMRLIADLGPDQIDNDVVAVLTHLREARGITPARTGIVGFCVGGRAAFTAATSFPELAVTVSFYGPGIAAGPHAVLDRTAGITGPVLMIVGDADPTIPQEQLASIQRACEEHGVDLRLEVFPGAGHAFHCDARPAAYHAEAATQAWAHTTRFLRAAFSTGQPTTGPRAES